MIKRLVALVVLAAVIAVLYFAFLAPKTGTSPAAVTLHRTADPEVLRLFVPQNLHFYADNYQIGHVYGEVKNNSDTHAAEVVLELNVYDKDRNLIKKLKVVVRDIPSGQVRTFDVTTGPYTQALVPEAKVKEVAY